MIGPQAALLGLPRGVKRRGLFICRRLNVRAIWRAFHVHPKPADTNLTICNQEKLARLEGEGSASLFEVLEGWEHHLTQINLGSLGCNDEQLKQ